MRHRQRGITFIGWVFLLVPVALVGYIVIRAVPLYLNYSKVAKAFEQTRQEYSATDSVNGKLLQSALEKRFDTGYIETPSIKDVSIRKSGEGWEMAVEYEDEVPLFYNASLLLSFEKSVTVP